MTDGVSGSKFGPINPVEHRADVPVDLTQTGFGPSDRYLKFIDNTKKTVALAYGICGLGFVICANRDDYLNGTLRRSSGMWGSAIPIFAIGIYACLVVTLALVVEYLARPTSSKPFSFRSLFVRAVFILCASAVLFIWLQTTYGVVQGVGAIFGTFLLLAAAQERNAARNVLTVLALIAICLTLMGTQTSYQYARRHADEIVDAGSDLANQFPVSRGEIQLVDSRVPSVFRKLGARRIWIDQERVAVYVGGSTEYQIYREPNPASHCNPVWRVRGKGSTKITDSLWTSDY